MFKTTNKDLRLPFIEDAPITSLHAFKSTEQTLADEKMIGLSNAQVMFANYNVLHHDFPRSIAGLTQDAIDTWLVFNTAYVSTSQAQNTVVSTPIPTNSSTRTAVRPPRYGRAAVMVEITPKNQKMPAIFDVKGIGVPPDEDPVLPNSNGLMTLNEAIHEILMEQLLNAVMLHAGVNIKSLPSYGLIDLGFDTLWHKNTPPQRAVALLRRSATRPRSQWDRFVTGPDVALLLLKIELLLRQAGISASSCGAVRMKLTEDSSGKRICRDGVELDIPSLRKEAVFKAAGWEQSNLLIDGVNVQITSDLDCNSLRARVMDFGRYRFIQQPDTPLYAWTEADYLSMNGIFFQPNADKLAHSTIGVLSYFAETAVYQNLKSYQLAYQNHKASAADLAKALRATVEYATTLISHTEFDLKKIQNIKPTIINIS